MIRRCPALQLKNFIIILSLFIRQVLFYLNINPELKLKVNGKNYRTIWIKKDDDKTIQIIDQRQLPHKFIISDIKTVKQMAEAIKDMHVRGAGLIGAAAGYGMYLAALEGLSAGNFDEHINYAAKQLTDTRPTAVNLSWAVERQLQAIRRQKSNQEKIAVALRTAGDIAEEDVSDGKKIGEFGLQLIKEIHTKKNGQRVNILTHCNAGWLAFVDYGSALAPVYAAFNQGIDVHVWVDETRPRNQGARLTAWELQEQGVPHTVIADNAGGHLMQKGMVDIVIVGSDRTTYTGDVANKIGTYLKALAAKDNNVPFYVALPSSSIDWKIRDGLKEIVIEQRNENEVKYIRGLCEGEIREVLLTPQASPAGNYAFDITPAHLVTGLITQRGICKASEQDILQLFPEHRKEII
jgi:methylthioribose-1-phosphate isomerase